MLFGALIFCPISVTTSFGERELLPCQETPDFLHKFLILHPQRAPGFLTEIKWVGWTVIIFAQSKPKFTLFWSNSRISHGVGYYVTSAMWELTFAAAEKSQKCFILLFLCLLFRAARGPPSCENEKQKYSLKRHKIVSRSVLQVSFWKSYCTCKVGSCHTHCLVLAGLPSVGAIVLPLYLCCLR